jgi:hypothetical protein
MRCLVNTGHLGAKVMRCGIEHRTASSADRERRAEFKESLADAAPEPGAAASDQRAAPGEQARREGHVRPP